MASGREATTDPVAATVPAARSASCEVASCEVAHDAASSPWLVFPRTPSPSSGSRLQPRLLPDSGTWSLEATPQASGRTLFPPTPSPCIGTACHQFLPRLLGGSS